MFTHFKGEKVNVRYKNSIYRGGVRFLHNFHQPSGAGSDGQNLFLGLNSGNSTLGSEATQDWESSYNVGIGDNSLQELTLGYDNTGIGVDTLKDNNIGYDNTAIGAWALEDNTEGYYNTGIGVLSLGKNTLGYNNTAIGYLSMYLATVGHHNSGLGGISLALNTSGTNNVAVGHAALYGNTEGDNNVGVGFEAGRRIGAGTVNQTSDTSIFIGDQTRASIAGGSNEIVIGSAVTGDGSNTVVIGNDSITKTSLKGNVNMSALNLVSYEGGTVFFEGNAVFN